METTPTPSSVAPPNLVEEQARASLTACVGDLDATRQRLREGVERSLNAYLATQSPKSLQAKNKITAIIGGILGRLGLSIDHEGRPCSFYTLSGTKDRNGRFRLVPHGTSRYVALSSKLEDFLPLKLIDSAPSIDLTPVSNSELPPPEHWRNLVAVPAVEVERQ